MKIEKKTGQSIIKKENVSYSFEKSESYFIRSNGIFIRKLLKLFDINKFNHRKSSVYAV